MFADKWATFPQLFMATICDTVVVDVRVTHFTHNIEILIRTYAVKKLSQEQKEPKDTAAPHTECARARPVVPG